MLSTVDDDQPNPGASRPLCHCCGKPVPEGNLAWDYMIPDPIAFISGEQLADRLIFRSEKVISVSGAGNFIQVILPIPVEHDRVATFGIWLNIPELAEWKRVMAAGRQGGQAWSGITFGGRIVTAVQPWPQIYGSWVQARVPGPDQTPRIVRGAHPLLAQLLAGRCPEEVIRSGRDSHEPRDMTGGPTPNPYARQAWKRVSARIAGWNLPRPDWSSRFGVMKWSMTWFVIPLLTAAALVSSAADLGPALQAAGGQGTPGLFVARAKHCTGSTCDWTGDFTRADGTVLKRDVYLSGNTAGVTQGSALPAVDTGAMNTVFTPHDGQAWRGDARDLAISGTALGIWALMVPARWIRRARRQRPARPATPPAGPSN